MFALRSLTRFSPAKMASTRNMGTGGRRVHGEFREKSFKEAWASDFGAYPVMGIIVFTVIGASLASTFFVATDKDARLVKEKRTNPFRGEFAKVAFSQDLNELDRQHKAKKAIKEAEEEVEEESA